MKTSESCVMNLRTACWLSGLSDQQTARVLERLPALGYVLCLALVESIADRNAGRPNAGTEALQSSQVRAWERAQPLTWRENMVWCVYCVLAATVTLTAVWWVLH